MIHSSDLLGLHDVCEALEHVHFFLQETCLVQLCPPQTEHFLQNHAESDEVNTRVKDNQLLFDLLYQTQLKAQTGSDYSVWMGWGGVGWGGGIPSNTDSEHRNDKISVFCKYNHKSQPYVTSKMFSAQLCRTARDNFSDYVSLIILS